MRSLPVRLLPASALALCLLVSAPTIALADWLLPTQRLTNLTYTQEHADVSGNYVVYNDHQFAHEVGDPDDPDTVFDIRLMDLRTRTSKILTPEHTAYMGAQISGDNVVWEDYGTTTRKGGIYHYKISSGVTHRLPVSGREIRISGNKVAYESFRSGTWRIYVYDLKTNVEKRVSSTAAQPAAPDISGNRVVWQDHRTDDFDIYVYDMTTGTEKKIAPTTADQTLPRISGNLVVWIDNRNGIINDDIYGWNLDTGHEYAICTQPGTQWFPAVGGNRVAWLDERSGGTDVYMWDRIANVEVPVYADGATGYQGQVSISGDKLVYTDGVRVDVPNSDVYLARIAANTLTVSAPSTSSYQATVTVGGRLTDVVGSSLPSKLVKIQTSTNGSSWTTRGTATTDFSGRYSYQLPGLSSKVYVRSYFIGDGTHAPAKSATVTHKPRVWLTRPTVPATAVHGVRFSAYGYLKPKHTAGTYPVKIRCYRKVKTASGWKYRYYKSVAARAADYGSYTKYKTKLSLPYKGTWRLRAYHASDTRNATTYSSYSYITVK